MKDHTRFQLVEAAIAPPGVDWVTRSPNGPFIDTGLEVKFNERGRLYLSVETVREMAEIAGLLEVNEAAGIEVRQNAYEKGYQRGLKENVVGQLDVIRNSLGDIGVILGNIDLSTPIVQDDPEPEPTADDPSPEPIESNPFKVIRGTRQSARTNSND